MINCFVMNASKYSDVHGKLAEEYRMKKLKEVEENIKVDIKRHAKLLSKYNNHSEIVQMICHVCNSVNVLSAGGVLVVYDYTVCHDHRNLNSYKCHTTDDTEDN